MLADLLYLFFPTFCEACEKPMVQNERIFCTSCRLHLPITNYHNHNAKILNKVFRGQIPIENATALFFFDKDSLVQNMIHNLKYRGHQYIGTEVGKWLGHELSRIDTYTAIDLVIPVPLHKRRLRERGYNQVHLFAKELASHLDVPYCTDLVIRTKYTRKLSKSNAEERLAAIEDAFDVSSAKNLTGKHILLVDDVITTGATVKAIIKAFANVPDIRFSIAAIAIAR